jgi:4-alpha-glucanotransferase
MTVCRRVHSGGPREAIMAIERSSGLLLHITSLPGKYGCGTMGSEAEEFVGFLEAGGQSCWQVLPLSPVCSHWNFSPYSSPSAFAGNEMLISPEPLLAQGWVSEAELRECREEKPGDFCDLGTAAERMTALLAGAGKRFFAGGGPAHAFEQFRAEQKNWLDDYALFRALADHFRTFQWTSWPEDISRRKPAAVARWQNELAGPIHLRQFEQFIFFAQWRAMKEMANRRGVRLIGDIPFYVNFESADAWACPEIFQLDEKTGRPAAVAGVPPDYFSPSGQRWGNPLYRWQERDGLHPPTLDWWTARVRHLLQLVDVLRIDHFRGFDTYWAIPASEPTAIKGQWRPGPGAAFFEALEERLGSLRLIAEDLGELTPGVEALRDRLGFPGMKILQFAFDGNPANPYLPRNYANANCLVYTGTHDNNTSNGWFYGRETSEQTKRAVMDYLQSATRDEFHWQFIELAMRSLACLAIFPVQDVLGLGEDFRMNTPGRGEGNWRWRLAPGALTPEIARRLLHLTELYNRRPPG